MAVLISGRGFKKTSGTAKNDIRENVAYVRKNAVSPECKATIFEKQDFCAKIILKMKTVSASFANVKNNSRDTHDAAGLL